MARCLWLSLPMLVLSMRSPFDMLTTHCEDACITGEADWCSKDVVPKFVSCAQRECPMVLTALENSIQDSPLQPLNATEALTIYQLLACLSASLSDASEAFSSPAMPMLRDKRHATAGCLDHYTAHSTHPCSEASLPTFINCLQDECPALLPTDIYARHAVNGSTVLHPHLSQLCHLSRDTTSQDPTAYAESPSIAEATTFGPSYFVHTSLGVPVTLVPPAVNTNTDVPAECVSVPSATTQPPVVTPTVPASIDGPQEYRYSSPSTVSEPVNEPQTYEYAPASTASDPVAGIEGHGYPSPSTVPEPVNQPQTYEDSPPSIVPDSVAGTEAYGYSSPSARPSSINDTSTHGHSGASNTSLFSLPSPMDTSKPVPYTAYTGAAPVLAEGALGGLTSVFLTVLMAVLAL